MNQDLSYQLEIRFDEEATDRDAVFPSIDLFTGALEETDRLLAGCCGLDLSFRRTLRSLGELSFLFLIRNSVSWPSQGVLGRPPGRDAFRNWLEEGRRLVVEAAASAGGGQTPDSVRIELSELAARYGLRDNLVYHDPDSGALGRCLEDMSNAARYLGNGGIIIR